ncbi:Monocarboxylate transporter 9, partial [Stegodyphus mimosarum]
MEYLCLTFGVIGGIGFGFIYLPAIVTVGFYFERRRALATGLAVCGSGVGTFLMAPFVQFLLSHYDWRGTMLILAGVVLNCAIFGSLFRPLPPQHLSSDMEATEKPSLSQRTKLPKSTSKCEWDSLEPLRSLPVSMSLPQMPSVVEDFSSESPTSSDDISPPPSYNDVVGAEEEERFAFLRPPPVSQNIVSSRPKKSSSYVFRSDIVRPFYRQDILYSASLLNLPEYKKSCQDLQLYSESVTKIPAVREEDGHCLSPAMKETFRQMLDLSLLRSPTFLLLGAGGFLTLAGLFVPFMFIVDMAVQQGISLEDATYFLPVIGLTNTVGRVLCGWISDRPSFNALTINNAALVVAGLATALSSCLDSIALLMAYSAIFGFAVGCFATLRSIVIVELLGLDKLTNAFGLLLLFQGLASMIGAPVAGMFYDATGSYDAPFYIAGSLILVSGIMGIPLPYLARWENNKRFSSKDHVSASVECPVDESKVLSMTV